MVKIESGARRRGLIRVFPPWLGSRGAASGRMPDATDNPWMRPSAPCISELAAVRLRVAAGVSPAVEPWRLARRHPRANSECALNLVAGSGRQDAALYGRRDAC